MAQKPEPALPSYKMLLLKTVLVLAAVCALAYLLLKYGLRWLNPTRQRYLNRIRVLDRQVLEGRRSLYLVELGERGYLLALTDTSVAVVSELGPAELNGLKSQALTESAAGETSRARSFVEVLLGGRKDPRAAGSFPISEGRRSSSGGTRDARDMGVADGGSEAGGGGNVKEDKEDKEKKD